MATPASYFGTTLDSLQSAMSHQAALDNQRQMAAAQRFSDIWKQVRDINERRRASEQDAGLKSRQIQNEADYRNASLELQREQLRMIPGESQKEREARIRIAEIEAQAAMGRLDPRLQIAREQQQGNVEEDGRIGDAIASTANALVARAKAKAEEAKRQALAIYQKSWNLPFTDKEATLKEAIRKIEAARDDEIANVGIGLGERSVYVIQDPVTGMFRSNRRGSAASPIPTDVIPPAMTSPPPDTSWPRPQSPSQLQPLRPNTGGGGGGTLSPSLTPPTGTTVKPTASLSSPVPYDLSEGMATLDRILASGRQGGTDPGFSPAGQFPPNYRDPDPGFSRYPEPAIPVRLPANPPFVGNNDDAWAAYEREVLQEDMRRPYYNNTDEWAKYERDVLQEDMRRQNPPMLYANR